MIKITKITEKNYAVYEAHDDGYAYHAGDIHWYEDDWRFADDHVYISKKDMKVISDFMQTLENI